jgi:hypothetical protein
MVIKNPEKSMLVGIFLCSIYLEKKKKLKKRKGKVKVRKMLEIHSTGFSQEKV